MLPVTGGLYFYRDNPFVFHNQEIKLILLFRRAALFPIKEFMEIQIVAPHAEHLLYGFFPKFANVFWQNFLLFRHFFGTGRAARSQSMRLYCHSTYDCTVVAHATVLS